MLSCIIYCIFFISGSGDSLAFEKHIYSTTAEDQTNALDNVHPDAEFNGGSYYKVRGISFLYFQLKLLLLICVIVYFNIIK